MRKKLTDRFLESIKPAEGNRVTWSDTLRPGLHLRVGMRKASWVFEKRVKGGPKRKHTLGAYCTWNGAGQRLPIQVTLRDARDKALEIEVEASQGVDRVAEAKHAKLALEAAAASRITTDEVLEKYASLKLVTLSTGETVERELRKVLAVHLGRPFNELRSADLQKPIDELAGAGRIVYANRIRAYLRTFTKWSAHREYHVIDIGAALQGAGRETPRDRVLSIAEVRAIYQATFHLGELFGPMFRLLLLTGQRRGEISKLKWSNVDLKGAKLELEGTQTKNRRAHITHLSRPALEELKALMANAQGSEFVFTTTDETPSSGISKAKRRLDVILGEEVGPWRLHDIRRAMATALASAGVPEGVVDRIQNHAATGSAPSAVARVYQQSELLPQRAAALDRWAAMITQKSSVVIEFSGKPEVAANSRD